MSSGACPPAGWATGSVTTSCRWAWLRKPFHAALFLRYGSSLMDYTGRRGNNAIPEVHLFCSAHRWDQPPFYSVWTITDELHVHSNTGRRGNSVTPVRLRRAEAPRRRSSPCTSSAARTAGTGATARCGRGASFAIGFITGEGGGRRGAVSSSVCANTYSKRWYRAASRHLNKRGDQTALLWPPSRFGCTASLVSLVVRH
jgi:hypothetical protein